MGALDSKALSATAVIAALILVVSAVFTIIGDKPFVDDTTIPYILLIAGVIALIYSVTFFKSGSSFVRKLQGIMILVTGIVFAASCFVGDAETMIAVAGIMAFVTSFLALLTYWISRTYGAMYLSAIFAAVDIAMSLAIFTKGFESVFAAIIMIVFAAALVLDYLISPYLGASVERKTREVIDAPRSAKLEKAQAKNKKATPKAKKPVKLEKVEESPVEEKKPAPKIETPVETVAPVEEKKPVVEECEKKEQKRPDKATGEFMEKLLKSSDANRVARKTEEAPVVERRVRTVALPKTDVLEAEKKKAEEAPKVDTSVVEAAPVEEAPAETVTSVEEKPAIEEVPLKVAPPVEVPDVPEVSVISEPIDTVDEEYEFKTREPDWQHVSQDSVAEEAVEGVPVEDVPVIDVSAEEAAVPAEDAPVEEEKSEGVPVEDVPVIDASMEDAPAESIEVEVPVEETPVEPIEPVIDESVSETSQAEVQSIEASAVDASGESQETGEVGEGDIFTDNSPEALVRRAAWNKGLRCRRNYGEHKIPVVFVKGKVAVYVTDADADASIDDVLRAEGWTVIRYDAASITDGKAQGEEIAATVKANTKAAKKKSRK